jgi:hypothetical protein
VQFIGHYGDHYDLRPPRRWSSGTSVLLQNARGYWPTRDPDDDMLFTESGDDMGNPYLEMLYGRTAFPGTPSSQEYRRPLPICGNLYLEMMQSWSIGHFGVRVSIFFN